MAHQSKKLLASKQHFYRAGVFKQFQNFEMKGLKEHCRGYNWLVVMLKSKTKLWPWSNYQAFMHSDHILCFENKGNQISIIFVNLIVQRNY